MKRFVAEIFGTVKESNPERWDAAIHFWINKYLILKKRLKITNRGTYEYMMDQNRTEILTK